MIETIRNEFAAADVVPAPSTRGISVGDAALLSTPEAWKARWNTPAQDAKNVHFLVLPAYARYNNALPLAINAGPKEAPKKDLLFFPLGYAHIISSLRAHTPHRVEVLDSPAEYVGSEELDAWLERSYRERNLPAPDYMMIGGMSTSWVNIKAAIETIRTLFPGTKVICGGTVANLHYEILVRRLGVHVTVIGEAEFITADLFHHLDDLSRVPGIAYLNGDGGVTRNPSPPPHDLNDIPEPAWDMFDIKEYLVSSASMVGFAGLPLNTSMGCPFACKFCYVPGGRGIRSLTPDNVVKRMQDMKDRFGLEYVSFSDDIMFVDKAWMWELGEKLVKANVGLMWTCNSRVNLFGEKDRPLLKLLKRAGLTRISFGIESGSPKILKNMGKTGVNPEKARVTLRLVREAGIRATASMLLGFPGETPETIQESVEFCKDNLLYPSFYLLQPFPGTNVYDTYLRDKIDEEEYLDLLASYRDGESFSINLTSMSDEELMFARDSAEAEMKKFYFSKYVRYFGWQTPRRLAVDGWNHFRRIRRRAMFLTP